jgi:hypothetical protein
MATTEWRHRRDDAARAAAEQTVVGLPDVFGRLDPRDLLAQLRSIKL